MTLGARVLGPLEIAVDGRVHRLSAPKRRALLAALVAAAGRPVPAPRLVDELWSGEPPATATSALQVHVSALRKVVGPALRTTPGGYLLDLGTAELDAARFEALLADAREQPAHRPDLAADRLAEALALWRGDAFEDVRAGPAVRVAAARAALRRAGRARHRQPGGSPGGGRGRRAGAAGRVGGGHRRRPAAARPRPAGAGQLRASST